jgi:putative glutamine amidotransferase
MMPETLKVLVTGEEGFDLLDGTANHVVRRHWSDRLDAANILTLAPLDPKLAVSYAELADGLLLPDGALVHPARFGDYHTDLQDLLAISGRRDELEFALVEQFLAQGKPILGLGRGASVLSAAGVAQDNTLLFATKTEEGEEALARFDDFVDAVRRHSCKGAESVHQTTAGIQTDAPAITNHATLQPPATQHPPRILLAGAPAYDRLKLEPSVLINHTYVAALTQVGGLPLLAFPLIEQADAYAAATDALLLTGSAMFAPKQELFLQLLAEEDPLRNHFDEAIYAAFKRAGKPILGICLGHQMINCYEGGDLKYDFRLQDGVEHMGTAHTVSVEQGSILYQLFGKELRVNSRHNNRVDQIAPTLRPTAFSPDGVIEALEHRQLPIFAVQWHPERSRGDQPEPFDATDSTVLFRYFIELATAQPTFHS